jgi:hypothetical protein
MDNWPKWCLAVHILSILCGLFFAFLATRSTNTYLKAVVFLGLSAILFFLAAKEIEVFNQWYTL